MFQNIVLIVNITSLMPTANSLDCVEVNDTVTDIFSTFLISQASFHVVHIGCLDEDTEYEVTVTHFVFEPQNVMFELDSVSSYGIT